VSQIDHGSSIGEVLQQLGRLALRDPSTPTLLPDVVRLLSAAMPPGSETSVCLPAPGAFVCESSGETARRLDETQFADGQGPTAQATRTALAVDVLDVRSDRRWPEHAQRAADAGLHSSLSIPLRIDARATAALTVYAPEADAFDPPLRQALRRMSPHARAAVASLEERRRASAMADEMEAELEARAVIGRAKGILVERFQVTPERAVELMVRMSARSRMELRDVAAGLVRRGSL
jgi:AmiR/NasT family two-component response regulator